MKKVVIPIILAAVLGIGGGIAAVTLNRTTIASAESPEVSNDLLKSGRYYLNGDVSAEIWFEVTPERLSLEGTNVEEWLMDNVRGFYEGGDIPFTEEMVERDFEENKLLYCDKLYQLVEYGAKDKPYCILVDRDNKTTDREELLNSNAGFVYNDKTNTISLSLGDFILVE